MRVAALYDIHANLPALEAVLAELAHTDVDAVVVGGDVAWGPFPAETVERLLALEETTLFVRGNADREVAARLDASSGLDAVVAEINVWCSDRLTAAQRKWLAALPLSVDVAVTGLGDTLFCHGSPRRDDEAIEAVTPDARIAEALAETSQPLVVCGHTHVQLDRAAGDARIVNAGSIGMPYEGAPGAYWALLGPGVELRRTIYDIDDAVARMRATACPHVEEAFVDVLLHAPDRTERRRHSRGVEA